MSGFVTPLHVGGAIVASAFVIQSGALFYLYRKLLRLQERYAEFISDYESVRDEIDSLRSRIRSLEGQIVKGTPTINTVTFAPSALHRVASLESAASFRSEYLDAAEDWPDTAALIQPDSSQGDRNFTDRMENGTTAEINFKQVDDDYEHGHGAQHYDPLKAANNPAAPSVELLWRLARATYTVACGYEKKHPKCKELVVEGHKYALQAHQLDGNNYMALKYVAILTGTLIDHLGFTEKIHQGNKFKEYLDKAIAMSPTPDSTILHMRGRYAFSIASLSWIEKKSAGALGMNTASTFDDAISDFLETAKIKRDWLVNLFYLGRAYEAKKDKPNAIKYYGLALEQTPADESEQELLADAKKLLTSLTK